MVVFCAQTDLQSVAPHIMSSLICVKWLVLCYPLEKMQQLRFAICVVGQLDMVFLVVSRCIVSYVVGSYFMKLIFISLSSRFVRKLTLLMSFTKRKF